MPWSDEMIPPEESIHDAQLNSIAEDELFDLHPSRIMDGHERSVPDDFLSWPNWPAPPLLGPDEEDDDFEDDEEEDDEDDYDDEEEDDE